MILYGAYVNGGLLDQVSGETEDSALAKLKMDYPEVDPKKVHLEPIDFEFESKKEAVVVDTSVKEEGVTLTEKPQVATTTTETKSKKPFVVIEAATLEIHITVTEGVLTKEDIEALEEAARSGMVMAKQKD